MSDEDEYLCVKWLIFVIFGLAYCSTFLSLFVTIVKDFNNTCEEPMIANFFPIINIAWMIMILITPCTFHIQECIMFGSFVIMMSVMGYIVVMIGGPITYQKDECLHDLGIIMITEVYLPTIIGIIFLISRYIYLHCQPKPVYPVEVYNF